MIGGIKVMIRHATIEDLEKIAELEAACFPKEEAATKEAFIDRLQVYPNHFWLLEIDGHLVSMVNGMVTNSRILQDEMYAKSQLHDASGDWQMIFGVETKPEFQGKGYASKLLRQVISDAKQDGRKGVVLTCKKEKIGFYERLGFVSEGVSESEHGGVEWYLMRVEF